VPIYEFLCDDCGPFEERRAFAEASDPTTCPSCGEAARRVYSTPATKNVPVALSSVMHRAEKSAYEPEVVRQRAGDPGAWKEKKPGQRGSH
jgi:putative FmdB family regulatory protein